MTKRIPEITKVVSDTGQEYSVDVLKDLYRFSPMGIKTLARKYGLRPETLERLVKNGGWDRLRKDHQTEMYSILAGDHEEILERRQSLAHRMESFKMLELEHRMDQLEEHYLRWGDPFARTSEGEIARDGFGQPLYLRPVSKDDLLILKDLEAIRETNRRILLETTGMERLKAAPVKVGPTLDATKLIHGKEETDDDDEN